MPQGLLPLMAGWHWGYGFPHAACYLLGDKQSGVTQGLLPLMVGKDRGVWICVRLHTCQFACWHPWRHSAPRQVELA